MAPAHFGHKPGNATSSTTTLDRIASASLPYAVSQRSSPAVREPRACSVKRCVILYIYGGDRLGTIHRVFSTLRDYAAIIEREA